MSASEQSAARATGLASIISLVAIISTSFGVFFRVIDHDDAVQTAQRILADQRLFRLSIAGVLVNCVSLLVLVTALYEVLKRVNSYLALLTALARLVQMFTWVFVAVNLFAAIRILTDPQNAQTFGPDRVPALANLFLTGHDTYYVGLLFWALGAATGSYLWFISRYVPRALAVFGLIASSWCIVCTLIFYVYPNVERVLNWWFDTPLLLFEMTLSVWLVWKGIRQVDLATVRV